MPLITYRLEAEQDPMLGVSPVEIGQADQLFIESSGTPVMLFSHTENGHSYWRIDSMGVADRLIKLRGWKTPAPLARSPLAFTDTVPREEYEALKLILGILVRQIGGAVTFSPYEVATAQTKDIKVVNYKDPHYMEVTVDE
jgi:hypothetical protein